MKTVAGAGCIKTNKERVKGAMSSYFHGPVHSESQATDRHAEDNWCFGQGTRGQRSKEVAARPTTRVSLATDVRPNRGRRRRTWKKN